MNLLLSSEINSLEIAYSTENEKEYEELKEFCRRYLNFDFKRVNSVSEKNYSDWRNYVIKILTDKLGKKIRLKQNVSEIQINTSTNNYSCFIKNTRQNSLQIFGILLSNEFSFLQSYLKRMPYVKGLTIEIQKGRNRQYDTIWGTLEHQLHTNDISNLLEREKEIVAEKIIDFIVEIEGFKDWAYLNRPFVDKKFTVMWSELSKKISTK